MTRYVMEAKENLDPALKAIVEAEYDAGMGQTYDSRLTQEQIGISYDRVRRKIIYGNCVYPTPAVYPAVNGTGFKLFSGIHTIDSGATYEPYEYKNLHIMEKDIDTGAVVNYDCWTAGSIVPAGVGGGDGTWRRFVETDYASPQFPIVADPRNGDIWYHVRVVPPGPPDKTCIIYNFRRSESFHQTISPYIASGDRHLEIFGINDDWVYIGDFGKNNIGRYTLELLPRERTAAEVTADYLLSYASFDFPVGTLSSTFRQGFDGAGNMYLFGTTWDTSVPRDYFLYKFEQPTSAPYGGPVVGGGFTDITPWASNTGPNAQAAPYRGSLTESNSMTLHYMPATDQLVLLNTLVPGDIYPTGTDDPADYKMCCTYYDIGADTFDSHQSFVTGYMTAAWTTTEDPNAAAWAIQGYREVDTYLGYNSYTFADYDYTMRWFFFDVRPVVGGVVTGYDGGDPLGGIHQIIVQYRFEYGLTPTVVRVLNEQGWDDLYTTYAAAIGDDNVVNASLKTQFSLDFLLYDTGFSDASTQSFWWSGQADNNLFYLDPDQTYKLGLIQAPFLRLSWADGGKGICRIRYGDTWG